MDHCTDFNNISAVPELCSGIRETSDARATNDPNSHEFGYPPSKKSGSELRIRSGPSHKWHYEWHRGMDARAAPCCKWLTARLLRRAGTAVGSRVTAPAAAPLIRTQTKDANRMPASRRVETRISQYSQPAKSLYFSGGSSVESARRIVEAVS